MVSQTQTRKISLPLLDTVRVYKKSWFRKDVVAGVTVAGIAIPQAMAYSQLAGAPLIAGLYAALLAMLVFAFFSSSRQVIVGPDAAMAALTGAAIIPLAHGNPATAAALIAMLSILIGIACIGGMVARIGFMAEFLSRPILLGYMAGLALSVIASQAPKLFGLGSSGSISFINNSAFVISHIKSISLPTVGLSMVLIAVGILVNKYFSRIPSALVLLVGSTAASVIFGFSNMGILTVGNIPTGLPIPNIPSVSLNDIQSLIVPALAIMVVGYANTIATARAFAAKNDDNINTTQEFLGLGLSNIASGLFSGIPVSASGARTAVNHTAKAKTQMSQMFGAITIGIALLLLSPLLKHLPVSALAVIISMAVVKLFDANELKSIWHAWHTEALLAIATIIGVTVLGVLQGLLVAVFLAIANLIRTSATPYDAVLGVSENGYIRDMDRPPKTVSIPGILMYRFDAPLYFANANFFRERVLYLIDNAEDPVKWFLWDAETITSIDSSAGKMLVSLIAELKKRNIVFAIARMKGSVREAAAKSRHLSHDFEAAPHYTGLKTAIESFRIHQEHPDQPIPKEKMVMPLIAKPRYKIATNVELKHARKASVKNKNI